MPKAHPEATTRYNKTYYAANRETLLAKEIARYWANAEQKRAYKRRYYAENREKVRAINKASRDKNLEKGRAYARRYRLEHPGAYREYFREYKRAWRAMYPEKQAARDARRRALKTLPSAEPVMVGVLYVRDNKTCTICHTYVKRREASIDHIIPLSKGGEHTYRNTALAHNLCNAKKNNGVVTQQLRLF